MERLLEREHELALLTDVVHGLRDGRGCLVLVAGEAGIGKTALVRALRGRAGGEATFLVGACEALSVPVPLGPLRELAEAAGDLDLADPGDADRLSLARRLLAALAARAPVVAVVEDAHWADPTTLDVLRLLARRVEGQPVALLLTYRDDEVAANAELGQLLGDLATRPSVRRLALRPLSPPTVRELADEAGLDAGRLARVSGGNPFLVVESIAAGGQLPATVRDAALARAGRLGPEARAAVDAAAVIGQRVAPRLLERVVPGSSGAVDEALAGGVLVADGHALGFRHELIREAIEASIPPVRRVQLHAAAAVALAAEPGQPDNARLAHHAELGGLADEACRYAIAAAADAERVGALRETGLQVERALRLGAHLPIEERYELQLEHSRATNFASIRLEDAVESAEAALALAAQLGDEGRRGRALVALSWALWSCDRVLEAKSAVDRAVEALERAGDGAELARARATQVRMEATAFDPAAALELAPAARAAATEARLGVWELDVEISVGLARGHRGDESALALLEAAARRAQAAGLAIQTVRTFVNLVYVAVGLRRHDVVDAAAAEALALFDAYQTTIPAFAIELYRARSLLDRGRLEEARTIASRVDRNWASERPVARALEGLVDARRGDFGSHRSLEQAWAELAAVPESSRHGTLRVALVEAAWLRDDRGAALAELEAAWASAATARFARPASDLAVWAARLGQAADPPVGAPEAVVRELAGDWRGAVAGWEALDAPYEAALAALPGDDRAARAAVASLHRLGAAAAARAFARERAAAGSRAVRGPRRSTLAHPAGLTRREQQVLELLATGATNGAIAAALHLSERTVAHHVSAILRKLDAPTRLAAVERARTLAQDGPPRPPT